MGLDMNLYKKHYVKNWEHQTPEQKTIVSIKGEKAKFIDTKNIAYITEEVMYWRKANAIHKWFVDNCNGGDDNNGEFPVQREDLEKLLSTCNTVLAGSKLVKGKIKNGQIGTKDGWKDVIEDGKVIKDSHTAEELLPTTSGFFFGGTDYDEYYYNDVKETAEMLTKLLAKEDGYAEYIYSASW